MEDINTAMVSKALDAVASVATTEVTNSTAVPVEATVSDATASAPEGLKEHIIEAAEKAETEVKEFVEDVVEKVESAFVADEAEIRANIVDIGRELVDCLEAMKPSTEAETAAVDALRKALSDLTSLF